MKMEYYPLSQEDINDYAMASMAAVVEQMIYEGFLTKDLGKTFLDHHAVILVNNKSFLKRWVERVWPGYFKGDKENDAFFKCVRIDFELQEIP